VTIRVDEEIWADVFAAASRYERERVSLGDEFVAAVDAALEVIGANLFTPCAVSRRISAPGGTLARTLASSCWLSSARSSYSTMSPVGGCSFVSR
jgi:hypothetical protein